MKKITLLLLIIAFANCLSATQRKDLPSNKLKITKGWQFCQAGKEDWYPAAVPGSVHTDLLKNKIIEDPFFGLNESKQQWIGQSNWTYKTKFDLNSVIFNKKNLQLTFYGLDTYADVYLNNVLVLKADNMFREWNINCKKLLKISNNELRVEFKNVFDENLPKWREAKYRLQAFSNNDQADTQINMYSRKAGFHFGWDWGPRFITCGIWRPVLLEGWDDIKLDDIHIEQRNITSQLAELNACITVISDTTQIAKIEVQYDHKYLLEREFALNKGENKISFPLKIKNPRLWWPNGMGEQYIGSFGFSATSRSGQTSAKGVSLGLRDLKIVREKDSLGTSFFVRVNGKPLFMKGANYIPQDNFQNRVGPGRYENIIKSAAEANMNMLRVWGGGIYENNEFYDLCDKNGILVWQEFMFACGMYPADEHFLENVRNEVIDNVKRIRNHCSLALYCGNNENEVAWHSWGWKSKYSADEQAEYEKDMKKLFYETIPSALAETDSTRYYHHSSPITGFTGKSNYEGDIHYWGVWHGKEPFENFEKNTARFVSEYGFQSYPEWSVIEKFAPPEERTLHSPVMLSHQRCMDDNRKDKEYGNRLISTYMDWYYKEPKDFKSYVYVSQVLQAFGLRQAIEAHRRDMPRCMGSLYWQIDDCWPVASWSSMDYYGNWKAAHYAARNAYEMVHIAPIAKSDKVAVSIISDKTEGIPAVLKFRVLDFRGSEILNGSIPVSIEGGKSKVYKEFLKDSLLKGTDENNAVLQLSLVDGAETISETNYYFVHPKDLLLEDPGIKIDIVRDKEYYLLMLSSDRLAKDICLSADTYGDFSDNYFDLLPGVIKEVKFSNPIWVKLLNSKFRNPKFQEMPDIKFSTVSLYESYTK